MPHYPRAPIWEAVIEFRFAKPIEHKVLEKAAKQLKTYPFSENEQGLELRPDGRALPVQTGIKLSSLDRTDVVIFRTTTFVCSRLAPYTRWEDLRGRAEESWRVLRRKVQDITISRIGVRYLNRIDVPSESGRVKVEDYITVFPVVPGTVERPMAQYVMQVVAPIGADQCQMVLNTATVPSPLIGHSSFILDLDVYREASLPKRDDELWALTERMRGYKNDLFESLVTDRARELFR